MSILDHAKAYPTGERYAVRQPFTVGISEEKLGDVPEINFGERYQLRMTLAVTFSCNRAQYEGAFKNAQRMLLHHLYEDTLYQIEMCKNALFGDDIPAAMRILDEMRAELVE